MTVAPLPRFGHLLALSNDIGTYEHADHTAFRPEHGYCTDDVARVLIVVAREPEPTPACRALARTAFRFLTESQGVSGRVRNRRSSTGAWRGERGVDDCWGRSLWAFGTAARSAPDRWMRESSSAYFERGAEQRSRWPRSMSFAALGAAEVLCVDPAHRRARAVLADTVSLVGPLAASSDWPWPEPRLSYANAAVAEALIAAGSLLGDDRALERGLTMLRWLLDRETTDGRLSPTPVGGAGPGDVGPVFDQQPIEVAAMADACARAAAVTGDSRWVDGVDAAIAWFLGDNAAGTPMWDEETGGGYDGLSATGPNLNEGAESTIALLTTLQHARRRAAATA